MGVLLEIVELLKNEHSDQPFWGGHCRQLTSCKVSGRIYNLFFQNLDLTCENITFSCTSCSSTTGRLHVEFKTKDLVVISFIWISKQFRTKNEINRSPSIIR